MNQIKATFLTILILVIVFLSGGVVEHYRTSNTSKIDTIGKEIKKIYVDRVNYIHDTIEVEKKVIKNKYIIDTEYVYETFLGSDSAQIALFDSTYPKIDTNFLMKITHTQAKDAINKSISQRRDSLLLANETKNVKNCDSALEKVVTKVDTLIKEKIVKKDNFIEGVASGVVVTIIALLFGSIYF